MLQTSVRLLSENTILALSCLPMGGTEPSTLWPDIQPSKFTHIPCMLSFISRWGSYLHTTPRGGAAGMFFFKWVKTCVRYLRWWYNNAFRLELSTNNETPGAPYGHLRRWTNGRFGHGITFTTFSMALDSEMEAPCWVLSLQVSDNFWVPTQRCLVL